MTATNLSYEYKVGGSLDSNAPSYVQRQADTAFYEALKVGQFCYVLNSRQMGKSSLRVRTMKKLEAEGTICIGIDLTGLGSQELTLEKWYAGIFYRLVSGGQLFSKIQWQLWWREKREVFSPIECLGLLIEEVLLVEIKENIVIFIDEIDAILSQAFSVDDFFRFIRYCYECRSTHPDYNRLTFALLGVAAPADLIGNKSQTPFNIGQAIQLQGFSFEEVQPLINGLESRIKQPQVVMKEILKWTGGQPFLTQKLCQLVIKHLSTVSGDLPQAIEKLVYEQIIDNWQGKDDPQHLRTISNRLLCNQPKAIQLLGLYQQIQQQGTIKSDGSAEQIDLRLSGLVVESQGKLKTYNLIYEAVFSEKWVNHNLEQLRPYSEAIAAWLASDRQDKTHLLRGETLQNALTWSLGKRLSEADYQFLVASQDLAKKQTQELLEITSQASQLLASARAKAKKVAKKRRINWKWLPSTATIVTVPILLLRLAGLLQELEWGILDQFFRWRPLEAPDQRITVITIDEIDLKKVGQWPVPDGILAKALNKIQQEKPQVIGLDIYRDFPVEPGHADLKQVFQSSSHLFGIEKVIGEVGVAPPPILAEKGQVGFADVVVDADGKVRRALLSAIPDDEQVHYSFAVQLVLHYLKDQNITLEPLDQKGHRVRLGKRVFTRFTGNDGGYVRAQSGGYQILLNWRGTQQNFDTFTLRDILADRIPPEQLRDRIVLIGITAESINDLFYTPYSRQWFDSPQIMPGIVIHANITSQILSSALDDRPLLCVWPDPIEWLCILVMGGLGAGISWYFKSIRVISVVVIIVSGIIFGGCYLAFIGGRWLPVVPAVLTLIGGAITVLIITNKQQERLQFQLTLNLLLENYQNDVKAGRIAIEYLKQSESLDHQQIIDAELKKL